MTEALREIWKKNFPLWPDALIDKFENEIAIESNRFDANYGSAEKKFYDKTLSEINQDFSWENQYNRDFAPSITLLNPQNQKFATSWQGNWGGFYVFYSQVPEYWINGPRNTAAAHTEDARSAWMMANNVFNYQFVNVSATFRFDARLFYDFSAKFEMQYLPIGTSYSISYLSIMSYSSMSVFPVKLVFRMSATPKKAPYAQIASLIALHENGKDYPGIDYQKLYDFFSYLNAYENYGQQIRGAAEVAIRTVAADLQNYRSDLDSKLLSQKNDLQNLQLSLTAQTQGQADSAKRDIQSLKIQAMGIRLQILGMLK